MVPHMHVLYDYQIFALQRRGGVSRYFTSLWRELQRAGNFSGELFLGVNQTDLLAEIRAAVTLRGGAWRDPMWPKTWRIKRDLNRFLFGRELARSAAKIYHPTYFWLPPDLRGKKLVLTVHDLIHELMPEHFSREDDAYVMRPAAIRRADIMVTVSETTKRDLCRLYQVPPERVFVTPLGCSLPPAEQVPSPPRPERPFLLYVGERAGYKNFKVLAAAWQQSERLRREFELVCFGGAEPTPEERALPGQVVFRRGDDATLIAAYQTASALIYPSLYEGFGLPLVEAFQYGCPVVTSGCGSISEVAGPAAAYFDPADPAALEQTIWRTVEDSVFRAGLVAKGFVQRQLFSWERCATMTRMAYSAALSL